MLGFGNELLNMPQKLILIAVIGGPLATGYGLGAGNGGVQKVRVLLGVFRRGLHLIHKIKINLF